VVDSSSNFVDQVEIVEFAPTERFFDVPNSSRLQTFLSQILH
jgi:hypothetical protein